MRRTIVLFVVAAAAFVGGCTRQPTAIGPAAGPPAAGPSATSAPARQPTAAAPPAKVAAKVAAQPERRAVRLVAAPYGYSQVSFGTMVQDPTGYAEVLTWIPAASHVTTTPAPATGSEWQRTTDYRDESRQLLVRLKHEPAMGYTDAMSLANVIADYRRLPSAVVTVTAPAHQGRLTLRQAEWVVDVPVGGVQRRAFVSAWVLNGQVLTVYASAPRGSAAVAETLYEHAVQLTIHTYIGPDGS